jgi:hypothetical protein
VSMAGSIDVEEFPLQIEMLGLTELKTMEQE